MRRDRVATVAAPGDPGIGITRSGDVFRTRTVVIIDPSTGETIGARYLMATPAGDEVFGAIAVVARGVADTAGQVPDDVVRAGGQEAGMRREQGTGPAAIRACPPSTAGSDSGVRAEAVAVPLQAEQAEQAAVVVHDRCAADAVLEEGTARVLCPDVGAQRAALEMSERPGWSLRRRRAKVLPRQRAEQTSPDRARRCEQSHVHVRAGKQVVDVGDGRCGGKHHRGVEHVMAHLVVCHGSTMSAWGAADFIRVSSHLSWREV